uniref:Putative ovule protein n=1 Tax=Solanum chacoense TaxID=4108 RepID=A0A0V0GJS7_SOLCH
MVRKGASWISTWQKAIWKFLAAWISSSEASILIPSRLYGSFTLILGKIAALEETTHREKRMHQQEQPQKPK